MWDRMEQTSNNSLYAVGKRTGLSRTDYRQPAGSKGEREQDRADGRPVTSAYGQRGSGQDTARIRNVWAITVVKFNNSLDKCLQSLPD